MVLVFMIFVLAMMVLAIMVLVTSIVVIVAGVMVMSPATAANPTTAPRTRGGRRNCDVVGIQCHCTAERKNPAATLTPVVTVSLVNAIRFPAKAVPVPRVDELPTCQNTLPASAPLARTTDDLLPVVSVLPIWKTYTPLPFSVSCPVNCADELKQ